MARAWPAGDVAPLIALLDEPGHEVVDGKYKLSETQARGILELRLQRLTGLERDKIGEIGRAYEHSRTISRPVVVALTRDVLRGDA